MRDEQAILDALERASAGGALVTFAPFNDDMLLSIERHSVEEAMRAVGELPRHSRRPTMASVRSAMREFRRKMEGATLTQKEADSFAADCALHLAHELMFHDGERLLRKPPTNAQMGEMLEEWRKRGGRRAS